MYAYIYIKAKEPGSEIIGAIFLARNTLSLEREGEMVQDQISHLSERVEGEVQLETTQINIFFSTGYVVEGKNR